MLSASEREADGIGRFIEQRNENPRRIANEEGIGEMNAGEINTTLSNEIRQARSDVASIHY